MYISYPSFIDTIMKPKNSKSRIFYFLPFAMSKCNSLLFTSSVLYVQAAKRKYIPLSDSLQFFIINKCSCPLSFEPVYLGSAVHKVWLPFSVFLCHVALRIDVDLSIFALMVTSSPTKYRVFFWSVYISILGFSKNQW